MAEYKGNEAAWKLVDMFMETNQAVAANVVAAQERNMQFVQSIFSTGLDVLKTQVESTRALMQQLEKQAEQQREAFVKLVEGSPESYKDYFREPLAAYDKALEAAEASTWKGLEDFQKAAEHGLENFHQIAQDGLEGYKKAITEAEEFIKKATAAQA